MDVKALWKMIESYGFKNQNYAELLALHEDGLAGPVVEARDEMEAAEEEIRKFLGITEDGEVDPLANFDLDTNYHAVLLTPNELRKKNDEH